jgi:hypothetical protein
VSINPIKDLWRVHPPALGNVNNILAASAIGAFGYVVCNYQMWNPACHGLHIEFIHMRSFLVVLVQKQTIMRIPTTLWIYLSPVVLVVEEGYILIVDLLPHLS